MASESDFTGFGVPSTNVIAADSYMVSILSVCRRDWSSEIQGLHIQGNLDSFTLGDDPLSRDAFGMSLLPHAPPASPGEYPPAFFPGIPPDTQSTLGVIQNLFHLSKPPTKFQRSSPVSL